MTTVERLARFETDGFAILPQVLTTGEVETAREACAAALASAADDGSVFGRGGATHGARNLLRTWPSVVELLRIPVLVEVARQVLGPDAGVVRGLYFDKPPGDGWALPWHRDTTVAVKSHGIVGKFGKFTTKAGVPHAEAPIEILDRMLTFRFHLDAMTPENGPLRVLPGSHRVEVPTETAVDVLCEAGDVVLMRPRLLHASSHCTPGHAGHRRVVHLELAGDPDLPDGYEWDRFVRVTAG